MAPTLKSAALWSGAATVTRLAIGFLSIKVTAVYLGPAGLALVAQVSNFVTLLQSVLGNAVNSAVVKLVAEAGDREAGRAAAIVGTALRFLWATSVLVSVAVLIVNQWLARWLLEDVSFWPVIIGVAVIFPLVMLGNLFVSLFTAHRRFELVSITHIAATIMGAIVFIGLCYFFGLWGGLIGIVLAYPATFLVALWLGHGDVRTQLLHYWRDAERAHLRPIVAFYPMLLAHSAALPLSLLLVRDILISHFGASDAGLWQASARLSEMYTLVFIAALSMYSLPTLSAARDEAEFQTELRRLVAVCFGASAVGALLLFVARSLVITLVFTSEFEPVRALWPWQLLGDVFLIAGWPMRSALMAKGRNFEYVIVEASIGIGFFAVTYALLERIGLVAANVAHAIVWGVVFFSLIGIHRRTFFPGSRGRSTGGFRV